MAEVQEEVSQLEVIYRSAKEALHVFQQVCNDDTLLLDCWIAG